MRPETFENKMNHAIDLWMENSDNRKLKSLIVVMQKK